MLILIGIWTAAAFLAWLFVCGAGRATESDSVGCAEHDAAIETQGEIPPKTFRKPPSARHRFWPKVDCHNRPPTGAELPLMSTRRLRLGQTY
jgi:hypothetical protein